MSWNYRVVSRDGGASYGIHEVYYENGGFGAWSENPISAFGENLVELRDELQFMMKALDSPILEEIDGKLLEKVATP